ncbi:hypothetical protein NDU88_001707 [Pleurodeles waltl]|uniref:Uncharacterized protein n=1 Tax=Pleurodeles waltl TaxID=8319 RepID=A0AAV7M1X0_PLEWA|nr:hypothetical protein NDU88_001707 [Pleurodeles waltl]
MARWWLLNSRRFVSNGKFLMLNETRDIFQLPAGQHLQYNKIAHIIRELWPSFPEEPEESHTLQAILDPEVTRGLTSRIYKALTADRRMS